MFEEVADQRQAAEERDLVDVRLLVGDDDAADDDGCSVVDGDFLSTACVSIAGMP